MEGDSLPDPALTEGNSLRLRIILLLEQICKQRDGRQESIKPAQPHLGAALFRPFLGSPVFHGIGKVQEKQEAILVAAKGFI